jgi:hypothetical protein
MCYYITEQWEDIAEKLGEKEPEEGSEQDTEQIEQNGNEERGPAPADD